VKKQFDYFKRDQGNGTYHYIKVYGGPGKTKGGYQVTVNFTDNRAGIQSGF